MFRTKDGDRPDPLEVVPNPSRSTAPATASVTQVAEGARIEGQLKTTGSVVVKGEIVGTLFATGDVEIGAQGRVEAQIEAKNLMVAGTVKGRIFAEGRVILVSGARVEGDIHAQSLKIEDSVFFQGGCVMGEEAKKQRDGLVPLPASVGLPRKAA